MKSLSRGIAWRKERALSLARIIAARGELASRRFVQGAGRHHNLSTELVVSLTSYPARFEVLPLTLRCLLTQTVRPDRVVLWIAHGDRDGLPPAVTRLCAQGLEIRTCKDIRSYKKIVPALSAFPSATIVTADDDLYFPADWLEGLVREWKHRPDSLPCHRAHRMLFAPSGEMLPYREWEFAIAATPPDGSVFPTSGAGVLYPPGAFHDDVLREDLFGRLCPMADDIWLYWMARKAGWKFRKVGPVQRLVTWETTQKAALSHYNLDEGGNDEQMRRVMAHYSADGAPPERTG